MAEIIYTQDALEALRQCSKHCINPFDSYHIDIEDAEARIRRVPSARLSEAYAKAVGIWLMRYQIKCAELKGRYTPYEVIGWVVSEWRKENEIQ